MSDEVDYDDLRLDLSDAEEQSFKPLDPGSYNCTLETAEVKRSKDGDPMVNWTWNVDGQGGRKVWSTSMLSFNDQKMTKGNAKNPPRKRGPMFRDMFFTLMLLLADENGNPVFTEREIKAADVKVSDILEQAIGSKITHFLIIDTEYDTNKVKRSKRYDPLTSVVDDEDMPL